MSSIKTIMSADAAFDAVLACAGAPPIHPVLYLHRLFAKNFVPTRLGRTDQLRFLSQGYAGAHAANHPASKVI
jgi:hypothetical protein